MSEEQPINLRQRVAVLRRCRGTLMIFVASAMASSLALTYVYSERYRADTTIMYRPTRRVQIKPEFNFVQETALGFPVPNAPFEVIGKTVEHVATSERVLRRVVEDLGLDEPDATQRTGMSYWVHRVKQSVKTWANKAWQVLKHGRVIEPNPTTEAIIDLAKNTKIKSEKDYTARIVVVAKDPDRAVEMVDRLAEVLLEEMRALGVEAARKQTEGLDRQIAAKKAGMEQTRKAIEQLKKEADFVSLQSETDLHLATAEELERKMLANEARLSDARARLKVLADQRQSLTPMIKTSETVADDPLYDKLREMKATDEVRLSGLMRKLPKDNADVQVVQAQIQIVKELLAGADSRRVSGVTTQLNALYQKVCDEELSLQASADGLTAENASLRESLKKVRGRIADPSVVSHLGELELQLRVQELEFTQLATALEEARITGLASVPEVQVLYKATKQDAPFRPIKLYHVGLSGFLALMIGIALAYMADFLRSSWNPPAGGGPAEAAQAAGAAREAKRTGMYVPSADKG